MAVQRSRVLRSGLYRKIPDCDHGGDSKQLPMHAVPAQRAQYNVSYSKIRRLWDGVVWQWDDTDLDIARYVIVLTSPLALSFIGVIHRR
ncbi:hypothetical protein EVAR_26822_1 [Eumeta japonica]|uniref:Uncharacterized protein n=1 Tax=Eumeta variegata TaxID=151549 RepID=A0A4C1WDI9_EUMVA|nr:hypothetical protein EVAR_26822_1 [Eumeta japonica]